MTLESKALKKIAPQIEFYLAGVEAIMRSGPAQKGIIHHFITERLADAQIAVGEMRRTYGLPDITDCEVLTLGAASLKQRDDELRPLVSRLTGSVDEKAEGLAATVKTAITEFLRSNPSITLPGLLKYAMTYELPNQQNVAFTSPPPALPSPRA